MKSVNKPTITIGIPAFNEAANIGQLLTVIQEQKLTKYTLEKILVASDASTDETNTIVKQLALKDPRITLIAGRKRQGQAFRINQMLRINASDIYVSLDADIKPKGQDFIEKLAEATHCKKSVCMAAANGQPAEADNYFEAAMNALYQIWYEARKDYNHGDNIYNHQGAAFALPEEIARKMHLPSSVVANQHYVYIKLKKLGYSLTFAKSVNFQFHSPSSYQDFRTQALRSIQEKSQLQQFFREDITQYFLLTKKAVMRAILKCFAYHPLMTSAGLMAHFSLRLPHNQTESHAASPTWNISATTKREFSYSSSQ